MPTIESLKIIERDLMPEFIALKKAKNEGLVTFAIAKEHFIKTLSEKLISLSGDVVKAAFLTENQKKKFLISELVEYSLNFFDLESKIGCVDIPTTLIRGKNQKQVENWIDWFNESARSSLLAEVAVVSVKKYLNVPPYCVELKLL